MLTTTAIANALVKISINRPKGLKSYVRGSMLSYISKKYVVNKYIESHPGFKRLLKYSSFNTSSLMNKI